MCIRDRLYGPAYATSSRVFQVLAVQLVLAFVNHALTHYLVAYGRQALLGVFTGAMLVLHATLSWLLIPRFGPVGPALSMIVAELLLTVLCLLTLRAGRPATPTLAPLDDGPDTIPA